VFKVKGVVNAEVGKVPTGEGVEDGTELIPGTEKVAPGKSEPSTIVPLAFSIALQTVIEPFAGGGVGGWKVAVAVHIAV
jgi:hypothetical protein